MMIPINPSLSAAVLGCRIHLPLTKIKNTR